MTPPTIQFNQDRYYEVAPRALKERERAVITALLARPFPGRDVLRQQLDAASVVMESTRSASIVLRVDRSVAPPSDVGVRIPAEAHGEGADGMWFEVLLHVVKGYIDDMETWRGDLEPIMILPDPSDLDIHIAALPS